MPDGIAITGACQVAECVPLYNPTWVCPLYPLHPCHELPLAAAIARRTGRSQDFALVGSEKLDVTAADFFALELQEGRLGELDGGKVDVRFARIFSRAISADRYLRLIDVIRLEEIDDVLGFAVERQAPQTQHARRTPRMHHPGHATARKRAEEIPEGLRAVRSRVQADLSIGAFAVSPPQFAPCPAAPLDLLHTRDEVITCCPRRRRTRSSSKCIAAAIAFHSPRTFVSGRLAACRPDLQALWRPFDTVDGHPEANLGTNCEASEFGDVQIDVAPEFRVRLFAFDKTEAPRLP
mmetsp:Transcript_99440/g.280608  ORF Transcript_99440/g.280608 Transcript_99440/m.280608 type:complete len:294 (-) Transcript_99440:7-888(-)